MKPTVKSLPKVGRVILNAPKELARAHQARRIKDNPPYLLASGRASPQSRL